MICLQGSPTSGLTLSPHQISGRDSTQLRLSESHRLVAHLLLNIHLGRIQPQQQPESDARLGLTESASNNYEVCISLSRTPTIQASQFLVQRLGNGVCSLIQDRPQDLDLSRT